MSTLRPAAVESEREDPTIRLTGDGVWVLQDVLEARGAF